MQSDERISRRVSLRDLRIVLAVTQAGGMAKAAQALAISQPVVSRAISDLERTLAVKLFDRIPHGIEPTAYGRQVAAWAVTIFDDMRQGVRALEFLQDPTRGELKVGAFSPLAGGFVSRIVELMTQKYPGIVIHVEVSLTDPLREALRERKLDMTITRSFGAPEPDLEEIPLFSDRMIIVAGVSNPISRRRKLALADIINEQWMIDPDGNSSTGQLAEACRLLGQPMPRMSVISVAPMMRNNLLASGRFVSLGLNSSFHFNGKRLGHKKLPIELPISEYSVCAMTLRQRTQPPLAKLFIEEAKQVAKEMGKPFV